jgi:hypothetical protein
MDIKTFKEFNSFLPHWQARLLMGPAGLGKSAVVKQYADKLGFNFVDLRLSELEPSDLVGLPYIEEGEDGIKRTFYAEPWWWPHDEKTVVFLDEVDRCREDMQPIAMQLTLDRRAGGRSLPEGVIVFAACNGEKFMTSAIDQALMNRFAAIDFTPSAEEWIRWAEEAGVHPSVIGFIRSDKNMLDTPENMVGIPNQSVPTRRSWTNFGFALNNLEKQLEKEDKVLTEVEGLHLFATPFVSSKPALTFTRWIKENYQVVTPNDIFSGKVKAENLNILQITNVLTEVVDRFMDKDLSSTNRHNCLKFFMDGGNETFAALFSALPKEAAVILEKFPDVDTYIKENIAALAKYHTGKKES